MEWEEKYSTKECYWQRRNMATMIFQRVLNMVENKDALDAELKDLNEKILKRHEKTKYRCVYSVDKDQDIDFKSKADGGFWDQWQRSYLFNLDQDEEEEYEDDIPAPGKPIVIYLKPSGGRFHVITEFTSCIHPKCIAYEETSEFKLQHPFGINKPVRFLFCKGHSEKPVVEAIEKHLMSGTPIRVEDSQGQDVESMLISFMAYLKQKIQSSYEDSISHAKYFLEKNELPSPTLEVECMAHPEDEDDDQKKFITAYVHLTECEVINS
jgi:hypothetical protein